MTKEAKTTAFEYRNPETGMVVRAVNPRCFWYADTNNRDAILIDLNRIERFVFKFGTGHAFAQSVSELKYVARRLAEGKPANYNRVTSELAVLNKIGCSTGVKFRDEKLQGVF